MEGLKNMIILKNLPSNIIEEAFIVVKPNLKIEKVVLNKVQENKEKLENDYIVKEAENIIKNYEMEIEKVKETNNIKQIQEKYKKLKKLTFLLGAVALMGVIVNFF